ncbi:MAG TPA: acyltransferase [Aliiroseovarius sp.]|nr:acyltransferase [Aliiroseovarius sp.]
MTSKATPPSQKNDVVFTRYDRRALTYANSFDNKWQAGTIRSLEWMTGKVTILKMIRQFEKIGAPTGPAFWRGCLDVMGVDLKLDEKQLARIPSDGPIVAVANHPHGMVDGMVLAEILGLRRPDYKILTRNVLTGVDEIASSFLIPVPFPHEKDAQRKFVEMRAAAMAHLKANGILALFPSGVVASSKTLFGPVVEADWNVFTAQLIRRSGARVVPIYFPGANSRVYQVANRVSATLRQGLLLREIVQSCNKPQAPVIGKVLTDDQMAPLASDPRGFMTWLREHTLSLAKSA